VKAPPAKRQCRAGPKAGARRGFTVFQAVGGSWFKYWVWAINAGIYIFDRRIEEELPQLGDHEDRTFPWLAMEGKMAALKSRAFWRGVDSFKDLQEAEEYLSLR